MIEWITLIIIIVFAIEYCIRLSNFINWLKELLTIYRKIFKVINSRASDHWKEKLVPAYTIKTFRYLFLISFWFIGLGLVVMVPVWIVDLLKLSQISIFEQMMSYPILLGSIPISILYYILRKNFQKLALLT